MSTRLSFFIIIGRRINLIMPVLSLLLLLFTLAAGCMAQETRFVDFVKDRMGLESNRESSTDRFERFCPIERDMLSRRVLLEYGSMFAASKKVRLPNTCVFSSAAAVDSFQKHLETEKYFLGSVEIELQEAAMEQLENAVEEAARLGLRITPLDGAIAGSRNYYDTVRIWNSRFHRALDFWLAKRKIEPARANAVRWAPVKAQIEQVVEWERSGFFFSTDFSKSIFHSVAPPGTSQHLSMLAFDVAEAGNPAIRRIMNKYGWFQTIRTDQPHFTFLGVSESELSERGLQKIVHNGNFYWVPAIDAARTVLQ